MYINILSSITANEIYYNTLVDLCMSSAIDSGVLYYFGYNRLTVTFVTNYGSTWWRPGARDIKYYHRDIAQNMVFIGGSKDIMKYDSTTSIAIWTQILSVILDCVPTSSVVSGLKTLHQQSMTNNARNDDIYNFSTIEFIGPSKALLQIRNIIKKYNYKLPNILLISHPLYTFLIPKIMKTQDNLLTFYTIAVPIGTSSEKVIDTLNLNMLTASLRKFSFSNILGLFYQWNTREVAYGQQQLQQFSGKKIYIINLSEFAAKDSTNFTNQAMGEIEKINLKTILTTKTKHTTVIGYREPTETVNEELEALFHEKIVIDFTFQDFLNYFRAKYLEILFHICDDLLFPNISLDEQIYALAKIMYKNWVSTPVFISNLLTYKINNPQITFEEILSILNANQ